MATILWADDEIDLLKPHIMFLKSKGYDVVAVNSGRDAIDYVERQAPDLVILDENMPGLTGLETLPIIKLTAPQVPVVMITKSEEENIMDQAVGSEIADYLIKPVNPNQILLSIKKNLHSDRLVAETATGDYRKEFPKITTLINDSFTHEDWVETYRKLVYWELKLAATQTNMDELLDLQFTDANNEFGKFISKNYEKWITDPEAPHRPEMSPDLFKNRVFPLLDSGEKVYFFVIDNFRLDQWLTVRSLLADMFNLEDDLYYSILPTVTQYARNAIFSGLMPLQIAQMFPDLWVDEEEDEGKNLNESPMIATQLERFRKRYRFTYTKINDAGGIEKLLNHFSRLEDRDLNVVVFNFIDMLSHAGTQSKVIRELAPNDAAYRAITESWFRHSGILDVFRKVSEKGGRIILTTDHGTIKVTNPIKIVGDRNTNTNLRYKVGRNLNYNPKEVFEILDPKRFQLPSPNITSSYAFAIGHDFFAYPNNFSYYAQMYADTLQHGGISMEEMLIPLITMSPK